MYNKGIPFDGTGVFEASEEEKQVVHPIDRDASFLVETLVKKNCTIPTSNEETLVVHYVVRKLIT